VPPPAWNVEDLSSVAHALDALRQLTSLFVKGEKPLCDAQGACHFTAVLRHVDPWDLGRWWEHDPILGALDHRIPCARAVGVLMEG